jgi:hypothetical protein
LQEFKNNSRVDRDTNLLKNTDSWLFSQLDMVRLNFVD